MPGASVQTTVIVRNHASEPREARVRARVPAGWIVDPVDAVGVVPGDGQTAAFTVTITAPRSASPGRSIVTADLELGGDPRGEVAECLIQVAAP